jgi:signal transduction histidine kinase
VDLTTTCQRAAERYYLQLELKQKNMELQKALTELQTLDKAKNQFMILINHELKTPLTSILSFTDLLKETRLDEEQEICVNRVKRSAERLQALINDSLIVVSQETNTLKIKKSKTLVSDLIPKINAELEQSLRSKNQKIDFQLASVFTLADAPMIQQVLSRLVHNACKFGKENSKIIVSGQVAGAEIIFQVINEGPPLKASVIEKITKPFFLDEDVMNHSVGYGLGLTVCQSLLQAHQSQLEFTNTDGGVQVQFRLPLID